ncbi:hypothetical protein OUZ56_018818 [Daphnia magna]|uniref:Uncharacterized protein n=1 Tax=Daphnia magna TaxID=35525 RepID=A0ABQ9Z9V8_9CRUS|nr:hypothetical protein OUZ56_018818 [Daphnia magna]
MILPGQEKSLTCSASGKSPNRPQQSRKLSTSLLYVLPSPHPFATLQEQHRTRSSQEETLLPSVTPASNQATFHIFHPGAVESNGTPENIQPLDPEMTKMGKLETLRPNLD